MVKGEYFKKHEIKTKYGFDRVVEDLIQEAMSKGDFENLTGKGKPLKDHQSQNPYVDFTTHKLNKILLDNGFTPEWIMLDKDIRESIDNFKAILAKERSELGKFPLNDEDENIWQKTLASHKSTLNGINKMIDRFNLLVPILNKQMVHIKIERIANKILEDGKWSATKKLKSDKVPESNTSKSSLMNLINSLFSN